VTTCLVGKPLRAVWQGRILACVHSGEAMGARQVLAAKLYSRSCQRKMVPLKTTGAGSAFALRSVPLPVAPAKAPVPPVT
jgi:hypothetical protein